MQYVSGLDQCLAFVMVLVQGLRGERLALFLGQTGKNRDQIDRAFGSGLRVLGNGGLRQPKGLALERCPIDPRSRQMPVNPVEQLVLDTSRLGQLYDEEAE